MTAASSGDNSVSHSNSALIPTFLIYLHDTLSSEYPSKKSIIFDLVLFALIIYILPLKNLLTCQYYTKEFLKKETLFTKN